MGLASRRIIQTIAKRNRSFKTDGARGRARLTCVGKDMLSLPAIGKPVLGIDEELSSVTFVVTSDQQDRDGDVINPSGLRLEEFKRNPVWFWNHQQEPVPIGTSWHPETGEPAIWSDSGRVLATCFFDTEDPFAMKIFGKLKRKMLSMCSIGFVPMRMERLRDKANHDRLAQPTGYSVEEAELVEISVTGVGSNRQALVVGRSVSPQKRREYGAKMKNRIRTLPTRKPVVKATDINEEGDPGAQNPVEKSSAADVQHVAISKEKYPNQADAVSLMDKQGLNTDDVRETDTDWEFHQFPAEELAPNTGNYEELDDGIKAFVGQRVMEPASDLEPEVGAEMKDAAVDEVPADVPVDDAPLDDTQLKPSAQALMDLIAHAVEQAKTLEEPDILAFYQDMVAEAKKLAKQVHPDLDLYDDSDEIAEVPDTDDAIDADEEEFEPYRHTRRLRTKGMSRRCMKAVEAAAEHLEDVADDDMADQKRLRMLKTGCRYHAKELRGMVKTPEMDDEPVDETKGLKVVSLAGDIELLNKAASGYDKLSKQVLGR